MPQPILCIDDDRMVLRDLEAGLSGDDPPLIHSSNPEEALEILRQEQPALVVIEIQLEACDGLDLVERARADREIDPTIPILVVTSAGRTPRLYGRAVQIGVEDYLSKPVPRAQLIDSVRQALSRERAMMLTDPIAEAPKSDNVVEGSLATLPLPELLDRLHLRGATGVLIIRSGVQKTGVQLRNGSPIAVSLGFTEAFEDFLVQSERITPEDRTQLLSELAMGELTLRESLLKLELIDEEGYEEALTERADERILRLFELPNGHFRFVARRKLKSSRALEITASVQSLIVRGVLARSSAQNVREALLRYGELYPGAGVEIEGRFEDVPVSRPQRDFITSLSGDRPIADFLSLSEFEQRTLYAFSILGAIKLNTDPMIMLDEVLDRGEAQLPEETPAEAPQEAPQEASEEDPSAEAEPAAAPEPKPEQSEAVRALEAESWYRKGQIAMKRKEYPKAVEAFGMSAHLDPGQGEYVGHLGYCLYLSKPTDELVRKEAMEHIARGIKLSPEQDSSYVFLGRIFKVTGDVDVAEQMFHRALAIRPQCREAAQELRLIEMRREKSSGLFNKLWSR